MSVLRRLAPVLLFLAAACGGDSVSVRGSLHPSLLAAGEGEGWTVWAEEAEREARVEGGEFELNDLAPGPVHLQLRREGREAGRITIPTLGAGMAVRLGGLRVDERTQLAFPSRIELEGGSAMYLNGIRYAPASAVPDSVDTVGTVLAVQPGAGMMLLRPGDEKLPDLRVVLGPGAGPLSADDLAAGNSLRVAGRRVGDHVVVSLVEAAGAPADGPSGDAGETPRPGDDVASFDAGDEPASVAEAPSSGDAASAAPVPVPMVGSSRAPAVVSRGRPPRRGRDDPDRGRGRGQGKGQGKGGKKRD